MSSPHEMKLLFVVVSGRLQHVVTARDEAGVLHGRH